MQAQCVRSADVFGSEQAQVPTSQAAPAMVSLSSCVLCTFFACAVCEMQGDVSAVDLGRTVADIAQRVAEDDGYGVAFAGDLSKALRGETAIASQEFAPPAFVGLDALAGADVVTLRPAMEATEDVARAADAFAGARASKRAASTSAFDADWQSMLDAETRAIGKLLRTELLA